jgi:hypothetical protein
VMSGAILAGGGDHGVASMEGLGGEGNPALRAGFQAPEEFRRRGQNRAPLVCVDAYNNIL